MASNVLYKKNLTGRGVGNELLRKTISVPKNEDNDYSIITNLAPALPPQTALPSSNVLLRRPVNYPTDSVAVNLAPAASVPSPVTVPTFEAATNLAPAATPTNALRPAATAVSAAQPTAPAASRNVLTPRPDAYSQYWEQPVGKTGVPLDMFVQLAGLAAKAFDPSGIGADIANLGGGAYAERMRRAYESPNKLLRERLMEAQVKELEDKVPQPWEAHYKSELAKGETDVGEIVKSFYEKTRAPKAPVGKYVKDNKGNYSYFEDGKLIYGTGKGEDVTALVGSTQVDEKGMISFFNKQGELVKKQPGGKPSAPTGDAASQMYPQYQQMFAETGGEGLPKNLKGEIMTKWEWNHYMKTVQPYMSDQGYVTIDANGVIRDPKTNETLDPASVTNIQRVTTEEDPYAQMMGAFARRTQQRMAEEGKIPAEAPPATAKVIKPEIAPPKYTEVQLRGMLEEKKKADPTIDVDYWMNQYKTQGLY